MKKQTSTNNFLSVRNSTAYLRLPTSQSGFSLIEVLISAMILSTSMLGVLSMQFVGLKGTHQSVMKQQALGVVQNAMERMAANRAAVLDGDYVLDSATLDCTTTRPDCSTTTCETEDVALLDKLILVCGNVAEGGLAGDGSRTGGLKIENDDDIVSLPSGSLNIACRNGCALGDVTVTVGWTNRAFKEETTLQNGSISLNLRVAAP
ncbi:MAG: type IV pilus modification protein PilV [Cocleimonas sp.]|nr:type IV pilus modification protein PilV [Cocleimonas sp.]